MIVIIYKVGKIVFKEFKIFTSIQLYIYTLTNKSNKPRMKK